MIFDEDRALKLADSLLQIKAVKLAPEDPFTWSSGWLSPIYCDNRLTLSYPSVRTYIRQSLTKAIEDSLGEPDVVAGVATGGIAIGALVAEEMGKPFIYVRSSSKGHGLQNKVEGHLPENASVVVVEDLISTGGSSMKAVESLVDAGASVKGVVSIFDYGFQVSKDLFASKEIRVVSLCDYSTLLKQAANNGYIEKETLGRLESWRRDPENWS